MADNKDQTKKGEEIVEEEIVVTSEEEVADEPTVTSEEIEEEIEEEVEEADIVEDEEEDDDEGEDEDKDDENEDEKRVEKATEKAAKSKKSAKKQGNTFNAMVLTFAILAFGCSAFTLCANFSGLFKNTNWAAFDSGNGITFSEGTIAEVASRVSPSVVSILTETRVQSWYGQSSTSTAAGTGVIVTADGYIITNKHVVEGAEKVSVVMDSGRTYDSSEVEVIGTDPSNDIAFLKIKGATDMTYAQLGDSKTLAVGQQVIAIGNALGQYQNTVTEGIVSGTGRTITASDSTGQNAERLTDMIQTDAAINAGNSGGPLVNAAGQVIGINTAVGSGNSLGFAIPISSIKGMLKSIVETGKLERAYLGVYYDSLTTEIAKNYNLSVNTGAYVHNSNGDAIIADSPAAKAGLKDGDIITRVGGAKVGEAGSLGTLIGEYAPGDTVTLTIIRDGSEQNINVTLAKFPTSQTQEKN